MTDYIHAYHTYYHYQNRFLTFYNVATFLLLGGSLAAIDFQPHTADHSIYETDRYTCLKQLHAKFKETLPSGEG